MTENNNIQFKTKQPTVTFVIGATATGKTTFIRNHFAHAENTECLNVYDYQMAAYDEAGYKDSVTFNEQFKCLLKANETLLADIIGALQKGKSIVVEHTMYKAKRRISYIEAIREMWKNIPISIYVMYPDFSLWKTYTAKRKLNYSVEYMQSLVDDIEFPNPAEGFDEIFAVIGDDIRIRMDAPKHGIIEKAHLELAEEARKIAEKEEKRKQRLELIESMNTRSFWHYCEVCGAKLYCTAQEAFDNGWDYPPQMGHFKMLFPRKCGKCSIKDTLFWKVNQQKLPIVMEQGLTESELKTWRRIKNEPESLLVEENTQK